MTRQVTTRTIKTENRGNKPPTYEERRASLENVPTSGLRALVGAYATYFVQGTELDELSFAARQIFRASIDILTHREGQKS